MFDEVFRILTNFLAGHDVTYNDAYPATMHLVRLLSYIRDILITLFGL